MVAAVIRPHTHRFLGRFFGRKGRHSDGARERLRSIAGSAAAEQAADMLRSPGALIQLTEKEARTVVAYMRPHRIGEGSKFIREGDTDNTGFMLLVLDGEVTVETQVAGRAAPLTVSVIGPGSVIGEMGLIDGAPRSASCTALTDLRSAVLTRDALSELLRDEPRVAAKLMMAVSLRIAQRMRESQEKLKYYAQLTLAMNEELQDLMPL